jgi:hypothetical protein
MLMHSFSLRHIHVCGLGLALLAGTLAAASALTVDSVGIGLAGRREFSFLSDTNSYYILYRGAALTNINTPVVARLGTGVATPMRDVSPQTASGFYRILAVPQNLPLDIDGDGMDDVFELTHPDCLDPLDPADASLDCDGDGRPNLQECYEGTDPGVVDTVPHLVINELDYDQPGTDTQEFVELKNTGTNSVNLSHYALVFINGANNVEYSRVLLEGTLAAGQYLVVASTNVSVAPAARVISFATGTNAIQNGSPDGVALLNVGTTVIVDALSYAGSVNAAMINGFPGTCTLVEGVASPATDSNSVTRSLIRFPDGTDTDNAASDWTATSIPTPGAANTYTP